MKKLLLLAVLFLSNSIQADNVYIISYYGWISEAGFFGDPINLPYLKLKQNFKNLGHSCIIAKNLEQLQEADNIVFFNVQPHILQQVIRSYPRTNKILYIWEPPVIDPAGFDKSYHKYFSRILTWDDSIVDNDKYHKFFYTCDFKMVDNPVPFEKRKFCTLISSDRGSGHKSELYTERKNTIEYFEKFHPEDFEFYGRLWPKDKYRTYRGEVSDKVDHLKNYKFSICYENMKDIKGYISEKIFDCFLAGCVPVYWGADNIEQFIPANCFVDRRKFKTNEELYSHLSSIDKSQFEQYLENMKVFFKSEKGYNFSMDNFTQILLRACNLK